MTNNDKKKAQWLKRVLIGLPLVLSGMLLTAYYAYWNHGNQFAFLSLIYNKFLNLFKITDDEPVKEWGVGALPQGVIYEDKVIFYFLVSICVIAFISIVWATVCYKYKEAKNSVAFNISINLVVLFYGIRLLTNNALIL